MRKDPQFREPMLWRISFKNETGKVSKEQVEDFMLLIIVSFTGNLVEGAKGAKGWAWGGFY